MTTFLPRPSGSGASAQSDGGWSRGHPSAAAPALRRSAADQPMPGGRRVSPARRAVRLQPDATDVVFVLAALSCIVSWAVATVRLRAAGQVASGWGSIVATGFWWPLAALLALVTVWTALSSSVVRSVRAWVGICLVILVTVGTQSLAQPVARLPTAWLHVAFVQDIAATGTTPKNYDARFSWPGFFAFWAYLSRFAGLQDLDTVLRLTPIVINLVAVAATLVIARRVCLTDRGPWFAALLIVSGNWIEQDYFSPQGSTYILAFVALALVVAVLTPLPPRRADGYRPVSVLRPGGLRRWVAVLGARPSRSDGASGQRIATLLLLVVLLIPAIIVSHQLTPYALAIQLATLALTGLVRQKWLPFAILLAAATWFVVGAVDYWQGHLMDVTGGLGKLALNVSSGVTQRVAGDAAQTQVKLLRIALTLAVALLGGFAVLHRRARREPYVALAATAAAPAAMVGLQAYGGEVFMRVALFALPLLAILAGDICAEALQAFSARARAGETQHENTMSRATIRRGPMSRISAVVIVSLLVFLTCGVTVARGGNDAYSTYTAQEITTIKKAINAAPSGARIMGLTTFDPMIYARIREVNFVQMKDTCVPAESTSCLIDIAADVIITTLGEDHYGSLVYRATPGWTTGIIRTAVANCGYRVQTSLSDVVVVTLADRAALQSQACRQAALPRVVPKS